MGENRGGQVAAVALLFLVLSWIFVGLRCYVRTAMMKSFGLHDWLAVVSLVLFTLYCTCVLKGVEYGTGQHLWDLPPQNIPIAVKWWWRCELFYVSSAAVLKVSIDIFLARICVKRSQTIIIWLVMGVVMLFSIIYFFIIVLQCTPPPYFWTQYTGGSGTCLKLSVVTDFTYAHSAISCVADWTLGILPIFLVWDLAMNPRIRGYHSCAWCTWFHCNSRPNPYVKQLAQDDFLWSTTDVAIWSTVEPGISITARAMATLRPLFRTFFSRSKRFGSQTKGVTNDVWPSSTRNPGRSGYLRNGSGAYNEDLGLRSDIAKGVNITTTIKSGSNPNFQDPESLPTNEIKRSDSERRMQWKGEGPLKDDSSEEFLPVQKPGGDYIRMTTEVTSRRVNKDRLRDDVCRW